MRLPLTARQQIERAHELGHDVYVTRRGPWPEHGDPFEKIYVSCSCGWKASSTRSEIAAKSTVAWHIGKVIGEGVQAANLNGGAATTGQEGEARTRASAAAAGRAVPPRHGEVAPPQGVRPSKSVR